MWKAKSQAKRRTKWGRNALSLFVLSLSLFGGCGQINEGWISTKEFVPAHEEESPVVIGDIDGVPIWGTETIQVPDKWFVTIRRKGEDGSWKWRTVEVAEDTYNSYQIDEWIEFQ